MSTLVLKCFPLAYEYTSGLWQADTQTEMLARLTPATLAAAIEEQLGNPPFLPAKDQSPARIEEMLQVAVTLSAAGDHFRAADSFRDVLELAPQEERALSGLFAALDKSMGGPGKGPQMGPNLTEAFREAMESQVAGGAWQAEQLSVDPPIYLLHDVLSREEAAKILHIRESHRERWSTIHPLVCFDHPSFQRSPLLQPHLLHGVGSGSRSCLKQEASQAAAPRIQTSAPIRFKRASNPKHLSHPTARPWCMSRSRFGLPMRETCHIVLL